EHEQADGGQRTVGLPQEAERAAECCRCQHNGATIPRHVDTVNTSRYHRSMPGRSPVARKPRDRYHHGDLRRALLAEAVRTIREDGVDALTVRAAGQRLGVSRTALYRHFADKSALLAGVAREGFQKFTQALAGAWRRRGRGWDGFEEMGRAYVRFAVENPAHYRIMFG